MKSYIYPYPNPVKIGQFLLGIVTATLGSYTLNAQGDSASSEEATELNPFVVDATADSGYVTQQSLSGSRFAQNMKDIPAGISVMTAEMMEDLAAYDMQEAMAWSVNSIASGDGDSSASEATGISDVERRNTDIRVRGILTTSARNFFKWSINSDRFNIGRIDTSRGPNALLFGASSLAGLSNVTTKQAMFNSQTSTSSSYDSNGGGRVGIDLNREMLEDKLALRVNAFYQDTDSWRDFSNSQKDGLAIAATWKVADGLVIRAEYETGHSVAISPKTVIRDQTNSWNHVTLMPTPGALSAAQSNAAGMAREGNIYYVDSARMEDGIINWVGNGKSRGDSSFVTTSVPADLNSGIVSTAATLTDPASLSDDPSFTSLVLPDWDYGNLRMAGSVVTDYKTGSIFVEKQFARNLFLEFGINHQEQDRKWHTADSNPHVIYYDLSQSLPNGYTIDGSSENPNVLKPFISSVPGVREDTVESDEARLLMVYKLQKHWFELTFGGNISYQQSESHATRKSLVVTNGTNPNMNATANIPRFRHYLSDSADTILVFRDGETYTVGDSTLEFRNVGGNGAGQSNIEDNQMSFMVFSAGSWGERRRLNTTVGIRRDIFEAKSFNTHNFDATTGLYTGSDLSDSIDDHVDSPSVGAVYHVTDWFSVYGNYSKSFVFSNNRQLNYQNEAIDPPIGKSNEFGIRFNLGRKLSASIGRYDSEQVNNPAVSNPINARIRSIYTVLNLEEFGQRWDTQNTKSTGYEFQVTANPTRSWTLSANLGLPEVTDTGSYTSSFDPWFAEVSPEWYAIASDPNDVNSAQIQSDLDNIVRLRDNIAAQDGLPSRTLIKLNGSLLTKYSFRNGSLKGLSLGAGVKYRGKKNIARIDDASVFADPYYESTMFARYGFKWRGRNFNLSFNVTNPFNDLNFRYNTLDAAGDGQAFRISAPRSFRLGLDVKL